MPELRETHYVFARLYCDLSALPIKPRFLPPNPSSFELQVC
jgi:hypothetical protein